MGSRGRPGDRDRRERPTAAAGQRRSPGSGGPAGRVRSGSRASASTLFPGRCLGRRPGADASAAARRPAAVGPSAWVDASSWAAARSAAAVAAASVGSTRGGWRRSAIGASRSANCRCARPVAQNSASSATTWRSLAWPASRSGWAASSPRPCVEAANRGDHRQQPILQRLPGGVVQVTAQRLIFQEPFGKSPLAAQHQAADPEIPRRLCALASLADPARRNTPDWRSGTNQRIPLPA